MKGETIDSCQGSRVITGLMQLNWEGFPGLMQLNWEGFLVGLSGFRLLIYNQTKA
jgi:hypothetical protein